MSRHALTTLEIEPTNICPNKCIICPQSKMKRKLGFLTRDMVETIIQRAKMYRIERFTIAGLGEPFYNDMTPNLIKELRLQFPRSRITIFTSGRYITDSVIDVLCDAKIDALNVSFFGYDRESYEKSMIGMNFNQTLQMLRVYCAKKPRNSLVSLLPRISKVFGGDQLKKLEQLLQTYGLHKCRIDPRPCHNFGGYFTDDHYVDEDFYARWHNFVPIQIMRCKIPIVNVFVSWNGDIYYCYIHSISGEALGNIVHNDLRAAERSRYLKHLLIRTIGSNWSSICSQCNAYATYRPRWTFRTGFVHRAHIFIVQR